MQANIPHPDNTRPNRPFRDVPSQQDHHGCAIDEYDPLPAPVTNAAEDLVWLADDTETEQGGLNAAQQQMLPAYQFLLRMLDLSIKEFSKDPTGETEFWRGRMFDYYGSLLCLMDEAIFGRLTTLSGLRRRAEKRLGLAIGHLDPEGASDEVTLKRRIDSLAVAFRTIAETIGHVDDPDAEKLFSPQRYASRTRNGRKQPQGMVQTAVSPPVIPVQHATFAGG